MTRIADATRAAYLRHRDALVGHLYRMTGEAAEAEDLVQEAFRRALERPPADLSRDLGGYLFRIATRLGIDHLRRVRRRRTAHLRLPEPWPAAPAPHVRPDAETRYEIEETASLAFLHALDVLTPMQRATLLLRDVYGFTTQETAEALGVSQGAVKQHLRRGRRTLAWRRPDDPRPSAARRDAARRLFDRAMARLLAEDVEGFAALLAEGATALSDGDGQYAAAPRPVVGREKVAALYGGLVRLLGPPRTAAALWIGGDPAVLLELTPPSAAFSPAALVCATTEDGERIRGIFTILAPRRLTRCAPRD